MKSEWLARLLNGLGNKARGGENDGFSHYVIENIGSKITVLGLAIMCMKTKHLKICVRYVDEKKVG